MALFEKVFKKKGDEIDIEEFLNNLDVREEDLYEDAEAFVKPVILDRQEDADLVIDEAKKGNIMLLNIENIVKRNPIKLREFITTIKTAVDEIDGDIARISHDRVIVTPSKVKIIKRR